MNTSTQTRSGMSSRTLDKLRPEAANVVDSMKQNVYNNPTLLSEYLLWESLHRDSNRNIPGDPVGTFILEQVQSGRRDLLYFIPTQQHSSFSSLVSSSIGNQNSS